MSIISLYHCLSLMWWKTPPRTKQEQHTDRRHSIQNKWLLHLYLFFSHYIVNTPIINTSISSGCFASLMNCRTNCRQMLQAYLGVKWGRFSSRSFSDVTDTLLPEWGLRGAGGSSASQNKMEEVTVSNAGGSGRCLLWHFGVEKLQRTWRGKAE